MKILLIEDSDITRNEIMEGFAMRLKPNLDWELRQEARQKMAKEVLSAQSYEFTVCASCADVREKYISGVFQLIILDGDLTDGSTSRIFDLFSNEKRKIVVHSSSYDFLDEATLFGFESFFKNMEIAKSKAFFDACFRRL